MPCRTLASLSCSTCVLYSTDFCCGFDTCHHMSAFCSACHLQEVLPHSSHLPCCFLKALMTSICTVKVSSSAAHHVFQPFQHFTSQTSQPPWQLTWSVCLSTAETGEAKEADLEVTMQSWRCSKGCGRAWKREVQPVPLREPASQYILGKLPTIMHQVSLCMMILKDEVGGHSKIRNEAKDEE